MGMLGGSQRGGADVHVRADTIPEGVPTASASEPEPECGSETVATAGTTSAHDLPRSNSNPHPEPEGEPVNDSHPFRSCLDRPCVQKEIRWARKYKKKIIVVFEKDDRKAGFFDHTQVNGLGLSY